uniref:NADH-ubiquinone oxidoreductase chain 2 n=1 Tax=Ceratocanthus sp. CER01 TaxID=1205613 RepID=A0A0S2MPL0_9SCAR|nr:NADH deshydrogenase subunit 2 [Ceratocanthus sp. CER01]
MMNLFKLIFVTSMTLGTLMAISSYSWMGMWIGLEINLFSIIPLINMKKNTLSSEASMKYFMTQALASTILMFSIIFLSMNFLFNIKMPLYLMIILNSALLTKMGAAPFHFWFPEIMMGLNWTNSMIMLTWQKIAPFMLILYSNKLLTFMIIIITSNMIISGFMGMNQINLQKIMTYSSINHMGWMLTSILFSEMIWIIYFIIYSILTINITWLFKNLSIFTLKQLYININNPTIKFFFALNFLSLGGLPPFLGFLPKWMTIQLLINNKMMLTSMMMVMMTLITLYFYTRITFTSIILKTNEINFYKKSSLKNMSLWMINFYSIMGLIISTTLYNMM